MDTNHLSGRATARFASSIRGEIRGPDLELRAWSRTFGPVGRCIYCGASGYRERLSEEHIIPYSLYGYLKLPYASCKSCAGITLKFEQAVARIMFGATRLHLGARTRRKREQPKKLPLKVRGLDGSEEIRLVPVHDHPHVMAMIQFAQKANLVGDRALGENHNIIRAHIKNLIGGRVARLHDALSARPEMVVLPEFFRLLAKIGHGYAVAHFGLNSFEPLLCDYILGKQICMADYIGASTEGREHTKTDEMHELQLATVWHKQDPRYARPLIVVSIRLFAALGMPIYDVVVGRSHAPGSLATEAAIPRKGGRRPVAADLKNIVVPAISRDAVA